MMPHDWNPYDAILHLEQQVQQLSHGYQRLFEIAQHQRLAIEALHESNRRNHELNLSLLTKLQELAHEEALRTSDSQQSNSGLNK